MSKVRINDLARELEVKSKQILDTLAALGIQDGKTHSSSLEGDEAQKVRAYIERGSRSSNGGGQSSRGDQDLKPKIDLSQISKPGDVLRAIQARKEEAERLARQPQRPTTAPPTAPATASPSPAARPAGSVTVPAPRPDYSRQQPTRPEPRKIFPQQRPPAYVVSQPAASTQAPAIASRPPAGPVVARSPIAGTGAAQGASTVAVRPAVAAPPPPNVVVVVKPPVVAPAAQPVAAPAPQPEAPQAIATAPAVSTPVAVEVVAPTVPSPTPAVAAVSAEASRAVQSPQVQSPQVQSPQEKPGLETAAPARQGEQPAPAMAAVPAAAPVGAPAQAVSVSAPGNVSPAIPPANTADVSADVASHAQVNTPVSELAAEAAPVVPAPPTVPARRVVMPQTGPRPVYKAPPPAPPQPTPAPGATGSGMNAANAGVLQRGKPIFDRRPQGPSGPGGFTPRPQGPGMPGQYPGGSGFTPGGGPRPKHPTRTFPGGPGGAPGGGPGFAPGGRPGFAGPGGPRPGFGAPRPGFGGPRPGGGFGPPGAGGGMMPPSGDAARPQRTGPPRGRGGRQQYPKTKEGPMKGFVPPPRFGGAQNFGGEPLPITREITVTEGISVKDLAEKLEIRAKDLIAILLMRGVFVTVNQSLDAEMVKDVAARFGAGATVISYEDEIANQALEEILESDNIDEHEVSRSPVVTVMGHVDHGKTSLLDAIRETDVAGGEAGGITQHIGAYKVKFAKEGSPASGREIVFLDTPGHEAFTRMRARGAKVTDLVVIVVAADDGPMPQTLEAIDHAKAANVPMIVAINKIDKPEANPEKVKKQLADRGLVPEDWGGSTVFVEVSAKKKLNLDLLLEMICLVSDLQSLKATPGRKAVGTVIEAKLDRGRGAVATVLVQNGTLKAGDSYIVGNTFGKVRAMFDDRGRPIEVAGPSTPIEVLGLEGMPDSGDTFLVVADRDKAKGIAQYRKMKEREAQLAKSSRVSLEGLAEQIRLAGVKDLPLILKGDVTGSVEVLADSLVRMSTEKVRIKVIHSGVGSITESDVLLASASNAIIIGFNVRPERKSAELAQQENVEIRLHSIIYELQDEITKAMMGLLDPTFKENYVGRAEILNVFKIPKVGTIAGARVTDGSIRRDSEIRVMRGAEQVYKGKIGSLKRFKDDAREVTNGMEFGIGLNNFSDLKEGDIIEAFTTEKVASDLGTRTSVAKEAAAREAAAKEATTV